jgi:hypothetical protein
VFQAIVHQTHGAAGELAITPHLFFVEDGRIAGMLS